MLTSRIYILLSVWLLELYDGWRKDSVRLHDLSKLQIQMVAIFIFSMLYAFYEQTDYSTEFSMLSYI